VKGRPKSPKGERTFGAPGSVKPGVEGMELI
jgi:hypothetical protein